MSMRIKRTFSFYEPTIKLLDLICAEMDTTNSSELIRTLIVEKAVRLGLINSTEAELENIPDPTKHKSEIYAEINRLEAEMSKMQGRLIDIEKMCFQIRDAENAHLNFLDIGENYYSCADDTVRGSNVNICLQKSAENLAIKKRNLRIEKNNFRK